MCGIAGYVGPGSLPKGKALLRRMSAAVAHRGPDGAALWQAPGVGLAHRRLAIIDVAAGQQPMAALQQRYRIVFNGEIYNHRELRTTLRQAGYGFATRSDTEVIPLALHHWGIDDGLRRLRGMFALALYDDHERSVLLARDAFGIKPLYWAQNPQGVCLFASEIKAILEDSSVPRRANVTALRDFFSISAPLQPHTAFADVHELPPGTWRKLDADSQEHRTGRFFSWQVRPQARSAADVLDAAESALEEAVVAHLESDVPVAALLSGGIDSALVVALMAQRRGAGVPTFTAGFAEARYDESAAAARLAAHLQTSHVHVPMQVAPADEATLCAIVEQFDQPFGDSSCIPTWLICQQVQHHTKVVLGGDGGDEMFMGYPRYRLVGSLAALQRVPGAGLLARGASYVTRPHLPNLARGLGKAGGLLKSDRRELLAGLHTYVHAHELRQLFTPDVWHAAQAAGPTSQRLWRHVPADVENPVEQLRGMDISGFLHADYLRKIDVMSSAHGLEVRVPYLDGQLAAFAATVPTAVQLRGGQLKLLLKAVAARHVPQALLARRKQGFGVPFDAWSNTPPVRAFMHQLLLERNAPLHDWVRPQAVQTLWEGFAQGRALGLGRYQVYQRIFFLVSLALWLRKWQPSFRGRG